MADEPQVQENPNPQAPVEQTGPEPIPFVPYKESCFDVRRKLEDVKLLVAYLRRGVREGVYEIPAKADENEMQANLTLAFRHLEDARMRLGKAIQAFDGYEIPGR